MILGANLRQVQGNKVKPDGSAVRFVNRGVERAALYL
jgi:hypothetical protein